MIWSCYLLCDTIFRSHIFKRLSRLWPMKRDHAFCQTPANVEPENWNTFCNMQNLHCKYVSWCSLPHQVIVCKLLREFRSSPNKHQLGWRRHRRPGDSSRDWTSSRCFPHWTFSHLAKRLHTIHAWDLWMGRHCGADILGRADWKHHPLSPEDHDKCALSEVPVSMI